jgi:hypothetical protein
VVPTATVTSTVTVTSTATVSTATPSTTASASTPTQTATPSGPTATPTSTATPGPCPTSWSCADVGSPALAGSQALTGTTWTIQGGGTDIAGTADQFHFVWQTLGGDGSISAHLTGQTVSSGFAKAGVMLRLTTDPASPYYAVLVTPSNGIRVQDRAAQGGGTTYLTNLAGTVPVYLMVSRSGTTFTAYTSPEGSTWTAVPSSTVSLANLTGALLAGMAVSSHKASALSTATFDTFSIG